MLRWNKISILIVILLLSPLTEIGYAQPAKPITLIYSEYRPETMGVCKIEKWWGKELEKRTGGRVKVNFYWSSSLVPPYDQMKALGAGIAHVGDYLAGWDPAKAPLFNISMLVPTFTENRYAVAMATRRLAEIPEAKAELERNNVKFLSPSGTFADYLHTRRPVTQMADIKGLKIRSWGPFAEELRLWGAIPVMMPVSEVYPALERGVVDGNNQSMTLIYSSRNFELAKHFMMFNMGMNPGAPLVMNLTMWNSLPPDIKKIVEEVSFGFTEQWVQQWEEEESQAIAKMKAAGCEFHQVTSEHKQELFEKAKPVWDFQAEILNKQGLPGKKIQETYFSYIREYEKKGKK
jgi:TRAP-type C4-dicarboxylate transport system substrate-binding protein